MRYAIYFAPMPGTPLHQLGSAWLGRDAHTGEALAQPDVDGLAAAHRRSAPLWLPCHAEGALRAARWHWSPKR